MAFDKAGLDSYIDVAQRIADFRERYPDGSLQPADPANPFEVRQIDGVAGNGKAFTSTFIVYTAACYRTPDDTRPGIGTAWEVFPGRTPYTLGSELMNAETSAWGRAILASLASDSKRGVASREEVRNRAAEQDGEKAPAAARKPRRGRVEPLGPAPERAPANLPRNQDGSISRSQATDDELAAAGVMTSAQQKEHSALKRGADGKPSPQDRGKLRHCGGEEEPCLQADCPRCNPAEDPWAGAPAGPPLRVPAPAPKLAGLIIQHLTRLGYGDRDVRLGVTAQLAGRPSLASTKDLTAAEGARVLKALEKCRDGVQLRELMEEAVSISA